MLPSIAADENRRLRTELGIASTDPVIGVVGSLYPVKGHHHLLAAVPQVLRVYPQATFLIVGKGDLEDSLREEVMRRGLERAVRFLGYREDVPNLLSIMDIFVLPSLSEGLSLALLEAMAAGKPVVATNVGGNPELVRDGVTGFSVPPQDPDAIAGGILSLLGDERRRKIFGDNGRQRVKQYFSLEAMADNYQKLYETCLENQ
jgi:glycosyltransferase involved in cell wall biosynthesis